MMHKRLSLVAVTVIVAAAGSVVDADEPAKLSFNRDIRPILSDTCFKCHGPDKNQRKADLRLDSSEVAIDELEVIVPGKPDESELVARITSDDPEERMPAADSGKSLTPKQIETLTRWIAEGAEFQQHWSLIAPKRAALPAVKNTAWCRNPIDYFILRRLEKEGLAPSPEASKEEMIRRVTFDLTGLPPRLDEIDAFLADDAPNAYQKVVRRLLASPAYGEHMACYWLDVARYGDTHGLHLDNYRSMWPYRDWVINAFNVNMPFDRFTIEQLAGDLLPKPTVAQRIATGFNRCNVTTAEGGSIDEEYYVRYTIDRVETTGTVWLGLTVGCAVCHEHKFDPISQKEFYQMYAIFNSIGDPAMDGNTSDTPPRLQVPSREQAFEVARIRTKIAVRQQKLDSLAADLKNEQAVWETKTRRAWAGIEKEYASTSRGPDASARLPGLVAHYPLNYSTHDAIAGHKPAAFRDGSPRFELGRLSPVAAFDGKRFVDAGDVAGFERTDSFSVAAWVKPTSETQTAIVSRMDDAAAVRGWDLYLGGRQVFVHLIHAWDKNAIRVNTKQPIAVNRWHHVLFTYDGSSKAAGVKVYVDGSPMQLVATHDSLTDTIHTDKPLHIGARNPGARFQGLIDDVQIFERELSAEEIADLASTMGLDWSTPPVLAQKSTGGATFAKQSDGSLLVSGKSADRDTYEITFDTPFTNLTAIRLEAIPDKSLPEGGPGRASNGNFVLTEIETEVISIADPSKKMSVRFAKAYADYSQPDREVAQAVDGQPGGYKGWAIGGLKEKRTAVFALEKPVGFDGGTRVVVRLRHESPHKRHAIGRFRLAVTADRIPSRNLPAGLSPELLAILLLDPAKRSGEQVRELGNFFSRHHAPAARKIFGEIEALQKREKGLAEKYPVTLISRELAKRKPAFMLIRGQYDRRGEQVQPAVPEAFPPLAEDGKKNRLTFARWLTDPSHPLASRVTVNRYWQKFFGTGIVKTAEDFGSQGEWPTHPELLDWLAVEFIESGWNVKRMQELLVTSAAYRQSSRIHPTAFSRDPENRLLARGPRFRLDAEMIRDQALAVSGLLVGKLAGPSVKPYQPAGLWFAVGYSGSDTVRFKQDKGEALYRRSLYTFWKRTSPPPSMAILDAPSRETCTVMRSRTNTPSAALLGMNDIQFVEADRHFAARIITEGGDSSEDRIRWAFRSLTARAPEAEEIAIIKQNLEWHLAKYRKNPDAAVKLISIGDSPRNTKLDAAELAAWTMVANMLLNLDETVTKG